MQLTDTSLHNIEQRLVSVRESRDNETKSSAGDKYETSRAMMQIEEDNLNGQKAKILDQRNILNTISTDTSHTSVQLGSVVLTNQLNFYISIALGKLIVDETLFYAVSPSSPIGQHLIGKHKGDAFLFNGKQYEILEVL